MKKPIRTLALILSHIGLVVSAIFLICFMIGVFAEDSAAFARLDFFVFDYFYLIIPLLCIVSGILLQISSNRSKRRQPADHAQLSKTNHREG